MVAVVRGERSPATSRAKTAPATRSAPQGHARQPSRQSAQGQSRQPVAERGGLGPAAAVSLASVVILGAAVGAVYMAHRHDPTPAAPAVHASLLGHGLAALGFTLQQVQVQGAPELAKADILRAAGLTKGQPILDIKLEALRQQVINAGWVKDAKIVRLLPDTLIIAVVPLQPLAIWQHLGVTKVVDVEGKVIGDADPARFPDLPLVVGEGADQSVAAIMPLLKTRPKLMSKIDALIRVDDRRWDLRLKDGGVVQLPAVGEDSALVQLDQLDQKEQVLDLGFERIDLRDPELVAVRPKESNTAAGAGAATQQTAAARN